MYIMCDCREPDNKLISDITNYANRVKTTCMELSAVSQYTKADFGHELLEARKHANITLGALENAVKKYIDDTHKDPKQVTIHKELRDGRTGKIAYSLNQVP